uniref:Nucleotide-diphosphate-sugar epimerase n=1 Tax=Thermosporothrix sp. COM3 TaxID=2490863 RepID=A0A455SGI5_9CHLR|nr:nucleotide-diphosphate-sugar epimerase [Thermosporothrix sp. COM3]
MSTILVTGGTGGVGQLVVQFLIDHDHNVRVYTHQENPPVPEEIEVCRGDIRTGSGLKEATADIDAIVHCASNYQEEGFTTDIRGTQHLLQAALQHDLPHIVYISIVGIDKSPYPYYKAKLEVEHMIEHSGLPWTILRATQFHDLVLNLIKQSEKPEEKKIVIPAGMRFQSIDKLEVAHRLVDLVERGACGHVPAMGGPQVLTIEEMADIYMRVYQRECVIHPMPLKSPLYDAFRSGVNIVLDRAVGHITWETFLRNRLQNG